jgi:hypothetical protein
VRGGSVAARVSASPFLFWWLAMKHISVMTTWEWNCYAFKKVGHGLLIAIGGTISFPFIIMYGGDAIVNFHVLMQNVISDMKIIIKESERRKAERKLK